MGISKHRERAENKTRSGEFLDRIRGVWIADEALSRMFDIYLSFQAKQKVKSLLIKTGCPVIFFVLSLKALVNEDTLLPVMFLGLRKLGNICYGHKICVRNESCAGGQTRKHLCR